MKALFNAALRRAGFDPIRGNPGGPVVEQAPSAPADDLGEIGDLSDDEKRIVSFVRPFTMTSLARIAALLNAVDYLTANNIPGDIAECGVWRGGSMMTVAMALMAHGQQSRSLYLYDTFEGMPPPTEHDRSFDGLSAEQQLRAFESSTGGAKWFHASMEDVRANILSTGYPEDKVHLIKGKVEDTIPATLPGDLSLLRLDTDWYESTKHELAHLYPLLNPEGILIIDDYGHWQGARIAVDEYFRGSKVYLHRVDYTGRLLVKSPV